MLEAGRCLVKVAPYASVGVVRVSKSFASLVECSEGELKRSTGFESEGQG